MLTFPDIPPDMFTLEAFTVGSWTLGPFSLRWYGAMYVLGFLSAWLLGRYRAGKPGAVLDRESFEDILTWGFFGVLLGGRLGYALFYHPLYYLSQPWELFAVWDGGMSFHGGMLGVMFMQWRAGRRRGKSFFQVMDFMAPLVPPGLFFGRVGNFINGELWGKVTTAPWGMVFPDAGPLPRHPSQLYEAFLEGLVLFAILWIYSSRPRPRMAVSGVFALGYGCFRFLVEFFRQPDAHLGYLAGNFFTMGMLLCLPLMATGLLLLLLAYRRAPAGACQQISRR